MSDRAYCVVMLDTTQSPPAVCGVGIFSEPWGSLTLSHRPTRCYLDLSMAVGTSFEDAVKQLRTQLLDYPGTRWAVRWMDADKPELGD